ncbi:MAG: 30S ribosomal protein S12 methylthiotransferase RimO [Prevotellaceae bacterium]|jgi:ribosomal protein S12 methylthiotransferase|nr:30S ribosomal protein S12 methylthiotransferase RimO [Prevotellaceae bacterium]
MRKNQVDIITLGCAKNLVDSERLMMQFKANGYHVRHDPERVSAEVVVVNTCGFIGAAKEESIATILALAEAKKKRRIGQLFVMGCLSERYLKELEAELPEVDRFYGKFDWQRIISDLGFAYRNNLSNDRVLTTPQHYAYVKIAEGCNRTCAYCAIPIITGKFVSRPIEEILREVETLAQNGVKEFQLIAQDLTFYGKDIYKRVRLADLVEQMAQIPNVKWIRLHYAYPHQFPMDILPVIRRYNNVCNYLDMALQHISDPMLKRMRRHITKSETIELIKIIRQEVPNIHLRTTLMLGHPGETEQDVEELITFVEQTRFEHLGTFAYSDEEGTYSSLRYNDTILQEEKQRRVDRIMSLQQGIAAELNEKKIGQTLQTIIDGEDEHFYIGRTEYDSPEVDGEVLIAKSESSKLKIGEFYDVKITASENFDLYGTVTK